jgi:hypothetical protein
VGLEDAADWRCDPIHGGRRRETRERRDPGGRVVPSASRLSRGSLITPLREVSSPSAWLPTEAQGEGRAWIAKKGLATEARALGEGRARLRAFGATAGNLRVDSERRLVDLTGIGQCSRRPKAAAACV